MTAQSVTRGLLPGPPTIPTPGRLWPKLPQPVKTATVKQLDQQSDGSFVAHVRYGGDEKSTTVRSVWEQVGDRPYITSISVVDE